jgi:fucose 4-O-acetylase-like acetyltransferase
VAWRFFFTPLFGIPVPLFFVISGFFAGRYSKKIRRPSLFFFFRKKLKSLILPFLSWNIILILLMVEKSRLFSTKSLFFLFTGFWQLYYIFALLQLLIINFYLERFLEGHRLNRFIAAAGFISLAFYGIADLLLWTKGASSGFWEDYLDRLVFPWGIFFVVGMGLRHRPTFMNWLLQKKYWLIGLSIFFYVAHFLELRLEEAWVGYNPLKQFLLGGLFFQFFFSLLVLVLLYQLENSSRLKGLLMRLEALSKDTYGIYLAHTTILIILFLLWDKYVPFATHWIEVPVLWVAIWFVCQGIISLVKQMRWRWIGLFLFGMIIRRGRLQEEME